MYGVYKECITNISIDIYGYSLYIPYIFHIHFLAMVHVFSLVCFLIYRVNRRQILIAKPRLYFFPDFTPFIFLINIFMIFHQN